ncbi:putative Bardet-Biedl syndrome 7 protein [Blattamonas nauphoetae]|uniref:Bardet-Biedl syndrome 7 protein n=1 Tax=Blattamonas nauphoetae TaxID=2049346 RepID=A0ABQ9Y102_9EUKA|nr:putative Bardet-Biedl syndrome 7 protein [Blattamonas nauphoetae]
MTTFRMSLLTLNLNKIDIIQVGPVEYECLKLLPLGAKDVHQSIIVGDKNGQITCITVKKKVTNVLWKHMTPDQTSVSAVAISIPVPGASPKVFVGTEQNILGMSKSDGKIFKTVETNITESLSGLCVAKDSMYLAGEYCHNVFVDDVDTFFYMADDRISSITLMQPQNLSKYQNVLLGCQDNLIRVVNEQSLLYECPLEGPVTALCPYTRTSTAVHKASNDLDVEKPVVYGTSGGVLGLVMMGDLTYRKGWTIEGSGGINSVAVYDIRRDGLPAIIVGRDNGLLEVYGFDSEEMLSIVPPNLIFQYKLNEAITTVAAGRLTAPNFDEVVISTFSGKVIAFTTEPFTAQTLQVVNAPAKKEEKTRPPSARKEVVPPPVEQKQEPTIQPTMKSVIVPAVTKQLEDLAKEVIKLQAQTLQLTDEYEKMERRVLATKPDIQIKSSLSLLPDEPRHHFVVSSSAPLDFISLQTDCYAEIESLSSNDVIMSVNPPTNTTGLPQNLSVTFKCNSTGVQSSTTRIEAKLHFMEGKGGMMTAFVVPLTEQHTSMTLTHHIHPLCLHRRKGFSSSNAQSDKPETDPFAQTETPNENEMRITGTFTAMDAHSWIHSCFDSIPPRIQGEVHHLEFVSAFLGTRFTVDYRKQEMIIRSNNLSTIAIFKDHLSSQTLISNIRTKISMNIKNETMKDVLVGVYPEFNKIASFLQQYEFLDCLKEIEEAEGDTSFFSDEQRMLLQSQNTTPQRINALRNKLEYQKMVLEKLYVDMCSINGNKNESKLNIVRQLLQRPFKLDEGISVFLQ